MTTSTLVRADASVAVATDPRRLTEPGHWRIRRLFTGRPEDPVWVLPALLALLVLTAVAYTWDLGASGWANSFYSAAVQAGTKSWKAFFFGSSDASNFITVDKPPASLWVMELSARLFGLNAWSILVPQALEGVATVALLYATVRRWFKPAAGLIAGAVLALTPVTALMFRYNNPDALLTLILTASAYATVRAIEKSSTRWLVFAGALVGFGFTTKMLQAFLVVPALGLAYLIAADTPLRRRIPQLVYACMALLVSAGWWVAVVQLTPAADRPYIGGSQNNSLLGLIFGYNGFGRLDGNESGSVVGGGSTTANPWGPTGISRLFTETMGGQISWLIPASLVFSAGALWMTRGRVRTDRTRAALVVFGGWLLVTGLVLSFAKGIIHPYYTIALAPAVGALIGIGAVSMWQHRTQVVARGSLALGVAVTAVWSFVLLDRSPDWLPPLRFAVLVVGIAAALLIAIPAGGSLRRSRLVFAGAAIAGAAAGIAGPLAYTLDTIATPHSGAIPAAGPTLADATGPFGGAGGAPGGFHGGTGAGNRGGSSARGGAPGFAARGTPGASAPGDAGTPGAGAPGGGGGAPPGFSSSGRPSGSTPSTGGSGPGAGPGAAGSQRGSSGFLGSSTPGRALVELLEQGAGRYTWVAATVGSNSAAGYQLATDDPVMAIGGFNGTDPAPTLAEFEKYVSDGKIHWFISTSGPGSGNAGTDAAQITAWVKSHYTEKTVDGTTIYDLSSSGS
jgi:4-amino-4-deoxy-L-arabinose transferase-like glycosyltransferase